MSISRDFQTAIEHIETLKRNFQRIYDEYPSHLDPDNRFAKGHYVGFCEALDGAIRLIRDTAEMEKKYGTPESDNVINLIEKP